MPSIFKLPWVGIEAFCPDYMHTLHLGVYQYVFGTVLVLLTSYVMPNSVDRNLTVVWEAIQEYYKVILSICYMVIKCAWVFMFVVRSSVFQIQIHLVGLSCKHQIY